MESHQTGVNFRSVVSDLIRAKSLELSKISQNSNDEYNILAFNLFPFLPEINDSVKGLFVPNINFNYTRYLGQLKNSNNEQPKGSNKYWCSGCGQPIGTRKMYHSFDCEFRKVEGNAERNS